MIYHIRPLGDALHRAVAIEGESLAECCRTWLKQYEASRRVQQQYTYAAATDEAGRVQVVTIRAQVVGGERVVDVTMGVSGSETC